MNTTYKVGDLVRFKRFHRKFSVDQPPNLFKVIKIEQDRYDDGIRLAVRNIVDENFYPRNHVAVREIEKL